MSTSSAGTCSRSCWSPHTWKRLTLSSAATGVTCSLKYSSQSAVLSMMDSSWRNFLIFSSTCRRDSNLPPISSVSSARDSSRVSLPRKCLSRNEDDQLWHSRFHNCFLLLLLQFLKVHRHVQLCLLLLLLSLFHVHLSLCFYLSPSLLLSPALVSLSSLSLFGYSYHLHLVSF